MQIVKQAQCLMAFGVPQGDMKRRRQWLVRRQKATDPQDNQPPIFANDGFGAPCEWSPLHPQTAPVHQADASYHLGGKKKMALLHTGLATRMLLSEL